MTAREEDPTPRERWAMPERNLRPADLRCLACGAPHAAVWPCRACGAVQPGDEDRQDNLVIALPNGSQHGIRPEALAAWRAEWPSLRVLWVVRDGPPPAS